VTGNERDDEEQLVVSEGGSTGLGVTNMRKGGRHLSRFEMVPTVAVGADRENRVQKSGQSTQDSCPVT